MLGLCFSRFFYRQIFLECVIFVYTCSFIIAHTCMLLLFLLSSKFNAIDYNFFVYMFVLFSKIFLLRHIIKTCIKNFKRHKRTRSRITAAKFNLLWLRSFYFFSSNFYSFWVYNIIMYLFIVTTRINGLHIAMNCMWWLNNSLRVRDHRKV